MSVSTTRRKELPAHELVEVLRLMKGSDSVELKLTVPESDQLPTALALGLDPLDAQIRLVFFFDTPDLRLNRSGVVVRARRIQGKAGDSVVKLRPVVPEELPKGTRNSPNLKVEVDTMPGGYMCSGSMKSRLGPDAVKAALRGGGTVSDLFSKEQRKFFTAHAPSGIGLDDLSVFGPVFALKLKSIPSDFGRPLVAELWLYPDGTRILELSTKCLPSEAFQVTAESQAYLTGKGVSLDGEQQTKTKTALEFFRTARDATEAEQG